MVAIRDKSTRLMIRLAKHGCTNRPFFHIVVIPNRKPREGKVYDVIGSYDPVPNLNNERLVGLDMMKFNYYWTQKRAGISRPVAKLLGILGYFPIHPVTRQDAFRVQRKREEAAQTPTEAEAGTEV